MAPENSLPQLGQVRWGSVLIVLTALDWQLQAKATARRTERCESGQYSAWQTIVPFHKQWRVTLSYSLKSHFGTEFLPLGMAANRLVS